jgi:hypothetical protein
VRPDGDALLLRQRNGGAHRRFVTGVSPARNIYRSNQRHQHGILTGAFPKITI